MAFIYKLKPLKKLPSAQLFASRFLDEIYNHVQGQVQTVLNKKTYFNFVITDDLANT